MPFQEGGYYRYLSQSPEQVVGGYVWGGSHLGCSEQQTPAR